MEKSVVANVHYGGDYRASLEEARRTGECIFCKPEFQEKKLMASFGEWIVLRNDYPTKDREGIKPDLQLLFVSVTHGNDEQSLSVRDFSAISYLLVRCKEKFGIKGGCFFFRDGDPAICGRTVRHPHAHYYIPRVVQENDGKPRTIPIDIPAG